MAIADPAHRHSSLPHAAITRRGLLRGAALSAGGLLIGMHLPSRAAAQSAASASSITRMNAWLHIGRDNRITFVLGRSEMGQGVHTGLATLIAEELDVDPMKVTIRHAPADKAYRNIYMVKSMVTGDQADSLSGLPLWALERMGRVIGQQVTGGSTSLRDGFRTLRLAGAEARSRLIEAAAAKWGMMARDCETASGIIIHKPSGSTLPYGAVADAAARLKPPADIVLKERKAWSLIGHYDKRLDTSAKIDGSAVFGLDVRQEGQLFAAVQWAPHFGASLKSMNADEARKQPGIHAVLPLKDGFVVIADNTWRAMRARATVAAEWTPPPETGFDDAALWSRLAKLIDADGRLAHVAGEADKAIASAATVITAEYRLPFLAHTTMEPMNATARMGADGLDIWAPTQAQEMAQKVAAEATGLSLDRVRIHTTYLGGGFGRRAEADFVHTAALAAKAVVGRTVQVMWPREEDTRRDFYRPAALHRVKLGLDSAGRLTAWKHDLATPSIMKRVFPPVTWMGADQTAIEGCLDGSYRIPNTALKYVPADTPVPVGFWRSVGHSHSAFVKECLIDEAAHAAKQDPLNYRRMLLQDRPRHRAVLDLAARRSDWDQPLLSGKGRGIALHESFGTIVAMVAEITIDGSNLKVDRITCAADAGTIVNPGIVVAQLTGGALFGLTAALYGRMTLKDSAMQESNFHDYRLLDMGEAPPVHVHLVESDASPGGIGEPGVPPVAPALANAIFAATGKRLRELPVTLT